MSADQPSAARRPALPFTAALLITLGMGVGMTALDVWQPAEPRLSILAFLPGLVSIAVLLASGSSQSDLYLRFGKLSRPGLIALAVTTILLLPILAPIPVGAVGNGCPPWSMPPPRASRRNSISAVPFYPPWNGCWAVKRFPPCCCMGWCSSVTTCARSVRCRHCRYRC